MPLTTAGREVFNDGATKSTWFDCPYDNFLMLVGRIVVTDYVDLLVFRHGAFDLIEKPNPFLMPMGDLPETTPGHVDRWIRQFRTEVQLPILHEMDHVLQKSDFSRSDARDFFARVIDDHGLPATNLAISGGLRVSSTSSKMETVRPSSESSFRKNLRRNTGTLLLRP